MAVDLNDPKVAEVLAQIRAIDWYQFEKLNALLFEDAGYTVERRGGAKADYAGVIQCKHWKAWKVPPKEIRELNTVRQNEGVQHAVCVTMRGFSKPAEEEAARHQIVLYTEANIVDFINKAEGTCASRISELLNDHRKFCHKCDSEMFVKEAKRGKRAGESGWACSGFSKSKCRNWIWIDKEAAPLPQPATDTELEAKQAKTEELVRYIMEKL